MRRRDDERGAALLTTLLLVAVMAALSVGLLDQIRFGLLSARNGREAAQGQWHLLGAEQLARQRIDQLSRQGFGRTPMDGDWNGRVFTWPLGDGTVMRASVRDGAACFNLNSVVEGSGEQLTRRGLGVAQFSALATAVGAPDAPRLAEALADWIDSNAIRDEASGAEDEAYVAAARPYRTANTLMSEPSELRAVRGVTPEIYARLRPYVCALPTTELSPINLNTLKPETAVVLTALSLGVIPEATARRALAARPAGGWAEAADFWRQPVLEGRLPPDAALNGIGLTTRWFALDGEVAGPDTEVRMSALFGLDPAGKARLAARRWSAET